MPRVDTALRIAADHARATAFLIHDGVLPSNEGRGYVLRKIMRRAMRNARLIGVEEPFLYKLTGFVAELMQPAYPELMESVQRVARVVKDEEHRYATTFLVAEKVFNDDSQDARRPHHSRRRLLQALRHLRPGARRAGGHGSRARRSPSTAKASNAKWSSSASAPAPVGRAPKRAPSSRPIRSCSNRAARNSWATSELEASSRVIGLLVDKQLVDEVPAGVDGRTGARPDAVLRRSRRPGGRSRRALFRFRREGRRCRNRLPRRARPDRASHRDPRAHPRGRRAARRSGRAAARLPRAATTPPRTCCTPRCARCWARTSSRPAAWSSPAACASTSPTTPPWTAPKSRKSSA